MRKKFHEFQIYEDEFTLNDGIGLRVEANINEKEGRKSGLYEGHLKQFHNVGPISVC